MRILFNNENGAINNINRAKKDHYRLESLSKFLQKDLKV